MRCTGIADPGFASASMRIRIQGVKNWPVRKKKNLIYSKVDMKNIKILFGFSDLKSIKVEKKIKNALKFFKNLIIGKNKVLIVSIPGKSTHIEVKYLSPLIDWNSV